MKFQVMAATLTMLPMLLGALAAFDAAAADKPAIRMGGGDLSFPDEMSMLEAQQKLLEKRNQVREALLKQASAELGAGLPRVISVAGFQARMTAKLMLADGTIGTFAPNQWISDVLRVSSIDHSGVYVSFKQKGAPVLLSFASASASTGGSGMPGLPGGFPGPGLTGQSAIPAAWMPESPQVLVPPLAAPSVPALPTASPTAPPANPAKTQ
ncbi:hypothetical protein [Noviherbaspirillum galbum]|uniref:Type IV pilus biogenesis protein PilP n=1 Tax=Noviherbaspirillum galbum TaxID=2709383 RepID=A0A6B3SVK4_9BURK|nr:hypothetical protein [Noviherbaspirillum galbum]NEX64531.1 hypothetical protein [Noviherbaspirillum galbum]